MDEIKTTIASISSNDFWQSLKHLFDHITLKQKKSLKEGGSPDSLPLIFLGKQSDLSTDKITTILQKKIKPENFSLIKIDPWLHPSHRKKGSFHDIIRQHAIKQKGYKLTIQLYSFKLFLWNNIRSLLFVSVLAVITLLLFHASHKEYIDIAKFFTKGAASLIAITLLVRILSKPIQTVLDSVFFNNNDHRYSLSTKEICGLIKKSYSMNRPFVAIIDHIELCEKELAISILNSSLIFSQYGMIIVTTSNQRLLNNIISYGHESIKELKERTKNEFYEEQFAFNYYFGVQLYDSATRHRKFSANKEKIAPSSPHPPLDTRNASIHSLMSKAISCYEISHREITGFYLSMSFYQQILSIENNEMFELITAFFIAYRYDRYFLSKLLLDLTKSQDHEINNPELDSTLLKTSIREKISSILASHSANAIALTQLVNDLNIPSE
jgi:hypothetical protein